MPYIRAWPWLQDQLLGLGANGMKFDLAAGTHLTVLNVPVASLGRSIRVVTPVCFEITVASHVRSLVFDENGQRRADLIASITNDGWFSDTDIARQQHLSRPLRWRLAWNWPRPWPGPRTRGYRPSSTPTGGSWRRWSKTTKPAPRVQGHPRSGRFPWVPRPPHTPESATSSAGPPLLAGVLALASPPSFVEKPPQRSNKQRSRKSGDISMTRRPSQSSVARAAGAISLAAMAALAGCHKHQQTSSDPAMGQTASKALVEAPGFDPKDPVAVSAIREHALATIEESAKSPEAPIRANAVEAASLAPDRLKTIIDQALDDHNPGVRTVAAMSVGKAHLTKLAPRVRPLLTDQSPYVKSAAIYALAKCGFEVDRSPLAGLLLHDPSPTGAAAMWPLFSASWAIPHALPPPATSCPGTGRRHQPRTLQPL